MHIIKYIQPPKERLELDFKYLVNKYLVNKLGFSRFTLHYGEVKRVLNMKLGYI